MPKGPRGEKRPGDILVPISRGESQPALRRQARRIALSAHVERCRPAGTPSIVVIEVGLYAIKEKIRDGADRAICGTYGITADL